MSPLALNSTSYPKVFTIADAPSESAPGPFAVRALSSRSTVLLSGKELFAYLKSLETAEQKLNVVDFAELNSGAPVVPPAGPAKAKEDAKIEGAVQIAIGVKKEVDFAAWYTNVRLIMSSLSPSLIPLTGPAQSGHARLLQRQRLLHPQAVVIQHLGGDSR